MPAFLAPATGVIVGHRCDEHICPLVSARRGRRPPPPSRPSCVRAAADLYKVLDIPRDADATTVKKAYRRAALRSHPDVSKAPDAKERFLEIQEAYATLSDASKRRAYDRGSSSSAGFAGFEDFAARASSTASGFSGGASQVGKKWRERNPMPEDLNDSLGSIFSDLFSNVSGAVGSSAGATPGIVEDFVEFLETQIGAVGGRGSTASGYDSDGSSDDGLDQVLASGSVEVLEAELDDTSFLLSQLRAREARLRAETAKVESRAKEGAKESGDRYGGREAREREKEMGEEVARLRTRAKKVKRHMVAQERRLARIKAAIDARRSESRAEASGSSTAVATSPTAKDQRRREVDDELERLKREMGL
jgi:curved DNA-binding protein CbpA